MRRVANLVVQDLEEIDVMTDRESIGRLADVFMKPKKKIVKLREKFHSDSVDDALDLHRFGEQREWTVEKQCYEWTDAN